MTAIAFQTTNWESVPRVEKKGETGIAFYRTIRFDGLRVRMVEYSAGYRADHWCKTGHIVYCIEGEMTSELEDGRTFSLRQGMSYVVSDDASCHRSVSENGVKLMIIDGSFLKSKKEQWLNPWRM
jgi:hypothetical protein